MEKMGESLSGGQIEPVNDVIDKVFSTRDVAIYEMDKRDALLAKIRELCEAYEDIYNVVLPIQRILDCFSDIEANHYQLGTGR